MSTLQNHLQHYELILASGSPRRKMLLEEMELVFRIDTRPVAEVLPQGKSPEEVAVYLSKLKADAFEADYFDKRTLIITADTVVALENKILGKPSGKEDAAKMLRQLSGREHRVITGVTSLSIKPVLMVFRSGLATRVLKK